MSPAAFARDLNVAGAARRHGRPGDGPDSAAGAGRAALSLVPAAAGGASSPSASASCSMSASARRPCITGSCSWVPSTAPPPPAARCCCTSCPAAAPMAQPAARPPPLYLVAWSCSSPRCRRGPAVADGRPVRAGAALGRQRLAALGHGRSSWPSRCWSGVSAFVECGPGECPDNPTSYWLLEQPSPP